MVRTVDVAIIGGGSGGLVVASGSAQLGLDVLLIEKERLGGDCLWWGCVPSKSLIESAKRIHDIRSAHGLGLPKMGSFSPSFPRIMERMRAVQGAIEPHDSPERFRNLGVDVRFGSPRFVGKREIEIGGETIRFRHAIIATGSSPRRLAIPGLHAITNVELFALTRLPKRLTIVGGGPVGVEMAQAFARMGSKVTLLVRTRLLPKEDPDHAKAIGVVLAREGIDVREGATPIRVEGAKIVVACKGREDRIPRGDVVLAAIGRIPNAQGLGLEDAGVRLTDRGIAVDSYLRTANRRIFAIGDVIGGEQFTHMASSHAGTVLRNILLPFKQKAESAVVPRVTFTDPELASVGVLEGPKVYVSAIGENDRARTQGKGVGEVKVVANGKGRILGASILAPRAGEMIMEFALAMKHGLTLQDIVRTIHPYPTLAEANKAAASQVYKEKVTPFTRRLARLLVRL